MQCRSHTVRISLMTVLTVPTKINQLSSAHAYLLLLDIMSMCIRCDSSGHILTSEGIRYCNKDVQEVNPMLVCKEAL